MIELRFSDVKPPSKEPHKTFYCDLRDVTDPVYMGLGTWIFNHDSVTLYMQVTGSGVDWTIGSTNLGSISAGSNFRKEITRFAQKAKPSGEVNDTIIVTLNAYTDSGYSNLKWTFEKTVSVFFFDSTDPSWTTDELDDFDDYTRQGWACFVGYSGAFPPGNHPCGYLGYCRPSSSVSRSAPYSLQKFCNHTSAPGQDNHGFFKTFTIPDKDEIYMIADIYLVMTSSNTRGFYLSHGNTNPPNWRENGVELNTLTDNTPTGKWVRLVAPLPRNVTEELRVGYRGNYGMFSSVRFYMDDFKIISRDN